MTLYRITKADSFDSGAGQWILLLCCPPPESEPSRLVWLFRLPLSLCSDGCLRKMMRKRRSSSLWPSWHLLPLPHTWKDPVILWQAKEAPSTKQKAFQAYKNDFSLISFRGGIKTKYFLGLCLYCILGHFEPSNCSLIVMILTIDLMGRYK